MLREAGYHFDVIAPTVSEPAPNPHTKPSQLAQAAAYFKAKSVWEDHPDRIVLAADTIVAADGQIYGKPIDQADARRILTALSGKRQAVITGVAILFPDDQMQTPRRMIASETTYVTFKQLSSQEIEKYIASGQWKDKAGAYGIQGGASSFVTGLRGPLDNVIGLPVRLVSVQFGITFDGCFILREPIVAAHHEQA